MGTFDQANLPVTVEMLEKEREPVREEMILAQKTSPSQTRRVRMRSSVQTLKDLKVAVRFAADVDCRSGLHWKASGYILHVTSQADRCNEGATVLDIPRKYLGYDGNVTPVMLSVDVSSNLKGVEAQLHDPAGLE